MTTKRKRRKRERERRKALCRLMAASNEALTRAQRITKEFHLAMDRAMFYGYPNPWERP